MTQGRPCGAEQKDFDILLRRPRRWPDANLPAFTNLEVRNVFYPDKRTFGRVLKHESADPFRYGGMASRNLDRDIEIPVILHRCWHAGERDFRMRPPATEHVRVGGSCVEADLHRRRKPLVQERQSGELIITKSLEHQIEY